MTSTCSPDGGAKIATGLQTLGADDREGDVILRARLHLVEQPHVLDRDHCLVGEMLQQSFLGLRHRSGLGPADDDTPSGSLRCAALV
jgi:hypothetical protein